MGYAGFELLLHGGFIGGVNVELNRNLDIDFRYNHLGFLSWGNGVASDYQGSCRRCAGRLYKRRDNYLVKEAE